MTSATKHDTTSSSDHVAAIPIARDAKVASTRRDALGSARDALVESVLAGVAGGVFEATRIGIVGDALGAWPVLAAVAALGAIGLAVPLRVLLAAATRVPVVASWQHDLAARRATAAWRALLAIVALVVLGFACFHLLAFAHARYRFNDADPVALVLTFVVVPLAFAVLGAAIAIDRVVAPRLADSALLAGRRGWIAAALGALLLAVAPVVIVDRAAPAFELAPIETVSVTLAAVVVARGVRLGRLRAARIAAAVAVIAALAGTWALGRSARARGGIVVYGVASKAIARELWTLADRDGDGFAGPSVGGADCDDRNAQINPGATEIANNGRDENCTGADATDRLERTQPRRAPTAERHDIVLISIDALRADHLGAWGYRRKTSPALDVLAAQSVRFAWAFTSCPSTRCAIPSLLTGRYASTLRDRPETDPAPSIAALLRDAGFVTAAVTCCERFSLAKNELAGFTTIDASADATRMRRAGQSNADVVTDEALEWLRARDTSRPYFLWLHYYEPHFPYEAPGGPDFGDDDIDRYDAEIAYADQQIGRLLAALDPQTIVVVTADHGDEFGEHGVRFHARSLYNQVVRVPLLVRAPGAAPHVVDTPVSIVDVVPTLLELAGAPGPRGMNGASLVAALHGDPAPTRALLLELTPGAGITRNMVGVISPPWKVIWDREANAWSLYNLADPDDTTDRTDSGALPSMQRLLRSTLDAETARLP